MASCSEFLDQRKAGPGFRYKPAGRPSLPRPVLRTTLRRCLLILAMAAAAGLAFNLAAPQGIGWLPAEVSRPLWQAVGLSRARELQKAGALFIDARDPGRYRAGRVRGALSLPPEEFGRYYPMLRAQLKQAATLVVYGRSRSRWPAAWVAQELARRGHGRVLVLSATLEQWRAAGYPFKAPRRRRRP